MNHSRCDADIRQPIMADTLPTLHLADPLRSGETPVALCGEVDPPHVTDTLHEPIEFDPFDELNIAWEVCDACWRVSDLSSSSGPRPPAGGR